MGRSARPRARLVPLRPAVARAAARCARLACQLCCATHRRRLQADLELRREDTVERSQRTSRVRRRSGGDIPAAATVARRRHPLYGVIARVTRYSQSTMYSPVKLAATIAA